MKLFFSSIQWMIFIIASSIVAPIAVADLYGMSPIETAGFVQRTLFVLGCASLLQGLFGHRLPIYEGPAGLWWGVFIIYASLSSTLFSSTRETLQALQGALIISGVVFILLSVFKLMEKIALLFTPVVLGVYLLLLVLQLSGSFMSGLFGIGYRKEGVDLPIAFFSLILILFTFYLVNHKIGWISQYGILIGLTIGWIFFYLFGFGKEIEWATNSWIQFPAMFEFGKPIFNSGLMITSIFITLLLITNMIASVQLVQQVLNKENHTNASYRRTGFVAGLNQIIGGSFSAIGSVPLSGAAGFIRTTNITSIYPFLIGALFVILISFSPQLMGLFSMLPTPVGYAVTFVVFSNLVRLSFIQFQKEIDQKRVHFVIGVSLLVGVGCMFVPPESFSNESPLIISILNNGLVLGSLTAIVVDQITRRFRKN